MGSQINYVWHSGLPASLVERKIHRTDLRKGSLNSTNSGGRIAAGTDQRVDLVHLGDQPRPGRAAFLVRNSAGYFGIVGLYV